jgi:hypothetical protein
LTTNHRHTDLETTRFNRSVAAMFVGLDVDAQRCLLDQLALLPRHVHQLATAGLISEQLVPLAALEREPQTA